MLSKVAIQKLIQPYPAGSFLISWCHGTMCNSIFLIANIKHLQFPDYSFCCGCICRNNQVQEKIVQSLSVFLMAKIEHKKWSFHISSFWGLYYDQGCEIELSRVRYLLPFIKSVCFFLKFIIFEDERSLVDIDQLPNISFRFFIKWAQLFFIGPESNHCLPLSLTRSLTDWLTDSLLFSKLDWCDPGVWR